MLDLKTSLNSLGLLLTLAGIWVLYVNSPLNVAAFDGGDFETKHEDIERETNKRNARMKFAVYALLAGGVLQLVSNYVPSKCGAEPG